MSGMSTSLMLLQGIGGPTWTQEIPVAKLKFLLQFLNDKLNNKVEQ
jgi:hypothetical protein